MDELKKLACQNIDVTFFQGRNALEWNARIDCGEDRFYIGPANIATVLNNVANLVRTEAAYADLKVHGPEEIQAASQAARPITMRAARARRAEKERDRAVSGETTVAVPVCDQEYNTDPAKGCTCHCQWTGGACVCVAERNQAYNVGGL